MSEIELLTRKLAESEQKVEELNARVEELNDFVENASIPLHWVDATGVITWANRVELELLGYTKAEYIGKYIGLFHADQEVIENILLKLKNRETIRNYPARLLCKDGEIKHVLINSNVLFKGDKFIHTRCFTRDITDLKKLEAEKDELTAELQESNLQLQKDLASIRIRGKS